MNATIPVKLVTIEADKLQAQQWELARLFVDLLDRPVTIEEARTQIRKCSEVAFGGTVSWKEVPDPAAF